MTEFCGCDVCTGSVDFEEEICDYCEECVSDCNCEFCDYCCEHIEFCDCEICHRCWKREDDDCECEAELAEE